MNEGSLKRILIVDDDRFMRITVKAIVSGVGRFVFEEAGDGTDALGKLADFRPDVVLCDIGMAPMSGIDFVGALRAQPDETLSRVPVIMLTADATESTIVTAARYQISGYLLKPVSAKRVASLFHTIFERRETAEHGD
jgi:two-component system chemotaxis response regulator CheY